MADKNIDSLSSNWFIAPVCAKPQDLLVQGLYLRQVELLRAGGKSCNRGQKLVIHFVVAGEISSFRALEAHGLGNIEVMPVHVIDIFQPTAETQG